MHGLDAVLPLGHAGVLIPVGLGGAGVVGIRLEGERLRADRPDVLIRPRGPFGGIAVIRIVEGAELDELVDQDGIGTGDFVC